MNNIVICLLGSSIMEGRIGIADPAERWYNILQRNLSTDHPDTCFSIVNKAVGGQSAREVVSRLHRDVLPFRPDFCLFMAGGNNHDCHNPERILGPGELHSLLGRLAADLPEKTQPVGVVMSPVVDKWHFSTADPAYRTHLSQHGGSFDSSLDGEREIARAFYTWRGWPYLDLYRSMSDNPERYLLPGDGIHLNRAGHALFARKIAQILSRLLSARQS